MATFNNRGIKAIVTDNSSFLFTAFYSPGALMYTAPSDASHLYTVLIFKNIVQSGPGGGAGIFNIYNEVGGTEVTNIPIQIGKSKCGSRSVMPNGTLGAQTYIQVSGTDTYEIEGIGILLKSGDKIYVRHENFYPGQATTVTYYTLNYYGTE